jgi:phage tail sheath protein FI
MATFQSPGVYIIEEDRGTRPIEAVGTAVAAFIGFSQKAEERVDGGPSKSLLSRPVAITNWTQYVDKFGAFVEGAYLPYAVYGYLQNGGSRCYVISVKAYEGGPKGAIEGGGRALLPARGEKGGDTLEIAAREGEPSTKPLQVTVQDDEGAETFTLRIEGLGEPEAWSGLTLDKGESNAATVVNARSRLVTIKVLKAAGTLAERRPRAGTYAVAASAAQAPAVTVAEYRGQPEERTGMAGLEALDDVTMLVLPDLMRSLQAGEMSLQDLQAVQQSAYEYCERNRYCFAILDAPPDLRPQQVRDWRMAANYDTKYAALYYPWIETTDMVRGKGTVRIPPSGHIAGIYARNDVERGVHKAPANEVVRGATALAIQVTRPEQDMLNPIGVNCIRAFPGRGVRVWGARTLSSDAAWRYVNVRRLFNMIEQSIERGTQWVVFEPNDPDLWARVRRDVRAFLRTIWASGALFGATPDQAFYVKCDEETNPRELRDMGQLNIEIGIAPVKPAEFVIFRITQWAGPEPEG